MRNNKSGIFTLLVDDQEPFEGDLYFDDVECSLFVDYYLGNGTHNMTIILSGRGPNLTESEQDEGLSITPVLHLTEIM